MVGDNDYAGTSTDMKRLFSNNLVKRILAALLMAPPAIAAVVYGGIWYDILLIIGAIFMAYEWCALTGLNNRIGRIIFTASVLFPLGLLQYDSSWSPTNLLAALALIFIASTVAQQFSRKPVVWAILGYAYVTMPIISLEWLRNQPEGLPIVIGCFLLVWGTDVGGYFAGKGIGGPKLAPTISPNKTWAGLFGGVLLAGLAASSMYYIFDFWSLPLIIVSGMLLAVWAQIGDLFESHIKRSFNKKDSGGLIPGHGGILDRIDGLIFVVSLIALLLSFNVYSFA